MDWIPYLSYKVVSAKLPEYIYNFIPPVRQSQRHPNTEKQNSKSILKTEWNKLNRELRSSGS